tara:strand:- start:34 stop:195 length:162 start_codon:yes stop_codon:yes gene_type:complete
MGSSNCEVCNENKYLDEFILGNKRWYICNTCVEYGLIMLINKVKAKGVVIDEI